VFDAAEFVPAHAVDCVDVPFFVATDTQVDEHSRPGLQQREQLQDVVLVLVQFFIAASFEPIVRFATSTYVSGLPSFGRNLQVWPKTMYVGSLSDHFREQRDTGATVGLHTSSVSVQQNLVSFSNITQKSLAIASHCAKMLFA
jgi:hypothetical protein